MKASVVDKVTQLLILELEPQFPLHSSVFIQLHHLLDRFTVPSPKFRVEFYIE